MQTPLKYLLTSLALLGTSLLPARGAAPTPESAGRTVEGQAVKNQPDKGRVIEGRVVDARTGEPVCGAVAGIGESDRWAVTDREGAFTLGRRPEGEVSLTVQCLGYVSRTLPLPEADRLPVLEIRLTENSLAIGEVVVTARQKSGEPGTAFVIGRNALDHLQMSNVTDIKALLPGGKTVNPDLTADRRFSLRDGGESVGNASFGTAVEVDGVRLGNNASFGAMTGAATRSIAVADIESVEVLTGVPSAEYGDVNSGIIRIRTRKGRTPWSVQFAANPRTYEASLSKGFDLGADRGVVNAAAEWTRATKKLVSPYTSYTRRSLSLAYSNTFRRVVRFEAGIAGNLGGMKAEDDPDAFAGEYTRERDNALRAHTSLVWLLDRRWITNLRFEASVNCRDSRSHAHAFNSYASEQPAVHAEQEGYHLAGKLPFTFFSDCMVDSRELECAASLKYEWTRHWAEVASKLKAGVQWRATGNTGRGEYYGDPQLAPHGYRPRPYSDYPFMHNLSVYAEEQLTLPAGATRLQLTAGLRLEKLHIRGAQYNRTTTLSPRLNLRWELARGVALRGGWGITEKLPSYYILYPKQEYRDIQTFGFSYGDNASSYIYYTQPYTLRHNPALRRQRNRNAEAGFEAEAGGLRLAIVGYFNRTHAPYKYSTHYTPFTFNYLQLPAGYAMPASPQLHVDPQTGMVYLRGSDDDYWTPMEVRVTDHTFVRENYQDNGADITRWGAELTVDLPEIRPLRTQLRIDAAYGRTEYSDESLSEAYPAGWSHPSLPGRSYPYVGIYANGGSTSSVVTGRRTHTLDANLTAITHLPQARIVITCRLEMALVRRSQNLSSQAFTVGELSNTPTGGDIYAGDSYTAVRPVAYLDTDGRRHPFTDREAADPDFAGLILKSNNARTFAADGYDPYFSANLSLTKEIGDHVSLSFFANNFTNSRRYVSSYATGVGAIFTPDFYYGLTCRLKF